MVTYRTLLEAIRCLPEDQLDMTATIYMSTQDECFPVFELVMAYDVDNDQLNGVVEENQPVMIVKP